MHVYGKALTIDVWRFGGSPILRFDVEVPPDLGRLDVFPAPSFFYFEAVFPIIAKGVFLRHIDALNSLDGKFRAYVAVFRISRFGSCVCMLFSAFYPPIVADCAVR